MAIEQQPCGTCKSAHPNDYVCLKCGFSFGGLFPSHNECPFIYCPYCAEPTGQRLNAKARRLMTYGKAAIKKAKGRP